MNFKIPANFFDPSRYNNGKKTRKVITGRKFAAKLPFAEYSCRDLACRRKKRRVKKGEEGILFGSVNFGRSTERRNGLFLFNAERDDFQLVPSHAR